MFVRELDTLGIAYHSPALNPFADKLRRVLHAVVPSPKERSGRWLSTSFPLDSEDAGAKTCGPDYHVRPAAAAPVCLAHTCGVPGRLQLAHGHLACWPCRCVLRVDWLGGS